MFSIFFTIFFKNIFGFEFSLSYFAVHLSRFLVVFLLVFLFSAVFIKGFEESFDVLWISGKISFVTAFHRAILIYLLMASLLSLFVDFGYLLSCQFLQIVIRITLNLNFLTCDNFHFMFVDHFSFYLKVRVVVWWLW